jgi:hypothetical protein
MEYCPKCDAASHYLYNDGASLACLRCGWRPTVSVCPACSCIPGDCDGHRAGSTGSNRIPCEACSGVAAKEATG